ncbi:MAG: helicase-related protein [Spirochaetales bacterium]|jgi:ATP-dependent DNA helicase RecQ
MNDQKNSLDRRGITSAMFRGGLEEEEWKTQCEIVQKGRAKIVITNPECLAIPRLREFLAGAGVFHMAIDEAHCVSEWGETFRPAYLKLRECIDVIHPKVVSALTATASPAVAEAIARHIFGADGFTLVTADMDKPNIRYSVEPTLSPVHTLVRLVRNKAKPLIVFGQSRDGVRKICEIIRGSTDLDAKFYHAGLSREEKNAVEAWFMKSADGVLSATCAYGLGVDKRDIRTVIHYTEPPSVEAYIQEAGRGGRDGGRAEAILIHCESRDPRSETSPPKEANEANDARAVRREAFLGYGTSGGCRRRQLLALMGSDLSSPCSGCDVCDGTARSTPEGLAEIREFFGRNGGRFDISQSARLLRQTALEHMAMSAPLLGHRGDKAMSAYLAHPPTCAGAGLLAAWDEREVLALLREALARGVVVARTDRLMKGRIFLARAASSKRS